MTCRPTCIQPSPSNAHCGAEASASFALTPWNGDPGFLAQRYTHLDQRPVDGGGIPGEPFANLVRAQAAGVQPRCAHPPDGVTVHDAVVLGGHWSQVLWSVVGPHAVDVVNVFLGRNPAVDHPVLVGFDVRLRAGLPAEPDIALVVGIAPRSSVRYALAGLQGRDGVAASLVPTRTAEAPLWSADDGDTTDFAGLDHGLILQVSALCHHTFSGVSAFDRHRRAGECLSPLAIGLRADHKGVWRYPAPDDTKRTAWIQRAAADALIDEILHEETP